MDLIAGQNLQKGDGVVSAEEALANKSVVCFYFSAHWCPPCRQFTPILKDFYEVSLKDSKNILYSSKKENINHDFLCFPYFSHFSLNFFSFSSFFFYSLFFSFFTKFSIFSQNFPFFHKIFYFFTKFSIFSQIFHFFTKFPFFHKIFYFFTKFPFFFPLKISQISQISQNFLNYLFS